MNGGATHLLARYTEVARLTAALRDALEADEMERLTALADQRAVELATADAELAALAAGPPLPEPLTEQIRETLAAALQADERLRALLVARAQEVPRQLADLRSARTGLGGYQATAVSPDDGEGVDRRG